VLWNNGLLIGSHEGIGPIYVDVRTKGITEMFWSTLVTSAFSTFLCANGNCELVRKDADKFLDFSYFSIC
jgi:hypothetical protein